jgi:hypothetical protein
MKTGIYHQLATGEAALKKMKGIQPRNSQEYPTSQVTGFPQNKINKIYFNFLLCNGLNFSV